MTSSRKLRLLYANAMYSPDIGGGAEIMVKTMAEGMKARGHDVQVLTTHAGEADRVDEVGGLPVHRLKLRNLYWPHTTEQPNPLLKAAWHAIDCVNPLMAGPIRAKLKAIRPDVLISNNLPGFSISLWREARALNIPIIQVLHDYYLICPRATLFKAGHPCQKQCTSCQAFRLPHKNASNLVTSVVGASLSILDTHLAHGLFAQSPVKQAIYNARPLPEPEPPALAAPQDPTTVFGFIGALTEVKGVRDLILAFKNLTETHQNCKLLIAGGGKAEYVAELRTLASTPLIEFLGKVNAIEFFKKIDYCVVPSIWRDPFPGVVYEAISQNVPVIGSGRGGMAEIIVDKVNGLLFNPDNPDSLVHTLATAIQLAKAPDAMRLRNIRATVSPMLNEARMLQDYEHVIDLTLNNTVRHHPDEGPTRT